MTNFCTAIFFLSTQSRPVNTRVWALSGFLTCIALCGLGCAASTSPKNEVLIVSGVAGDSTHKAVAIISPNKIAEAKLSEEAFRSHLTEIIAADILRSTVVELFGELFETPNRTSNSAAPLPPLINMQDPGMQRLLADGIQVEMRQTKGTETVVISRFTVSLDGVKEN